MRHVDSKAADEQMCAWLRAEAAAGRLNWRHIAIDGKTVRGAVQPGGTRPHLLAAYDVTACAALGQDEVNVKTNEITCFVPRLNAILAGHDGAPADDSNSSACNHRKETKPLHATQTMDTYFDPTPGL